jgi:23S rRNA (uridine2552-2'-O)-methyltransferase
MRYSVYESVNELAMAKGARSAKGGSVRGGRWMDEHVNDPYVQRARAAGYRSRAAWKLVELDERDRVFAGARLVVDLGAAPGSWSQVARERVGDRGRVIALDLLEMDGIVGVQFVQGDFREPGPLAALESLLDGQPVDLVLSDMAPNISGIASADQARAAALGELAWEFAQGHLKPGGNLVVKAFQGPDFKPFVDGLRQCFETVATRKPAASRDRSSEMYVVAKGYRKTVLPPP